MNGYPVKRSVPRGAFLGSMSIGCYGKHGIFKRSGEHGPLAIGKNQVGRIQTGKIFSHAILFMSDILILAAAFVDIYADLGYSILMHFAVSPLENKFAIKGAFDVLRPYLIQLHVIIIICFLQRSINRYEFFV